MKEHQHYTISISLSVALSIAALCTTAHAVNSIYQNTTFGWVYEMDDPTKWRHHRRPEYPVLPGAGPTGAPAYYRPGNTGGGDDASQYMWSFTWTPLPNVGQNNPPIGTYKAQMYVSDYGALAHEGDGFWFGQWPMGMALHGQFLVVEWRSPSHAGLDPRPGKLDRRIRLAVKRRLVNGVYDDMTVSAKWNPWGGYGGFAVSGVRISTDGNFEMIPEPSALALGLLGGLALWSRRAKR